MKEPPPADTFCFRALLICLVLLLPALFSCSEDPVDVSAAQAHLLFDWADDEGLPTERLSVFVELKSNARRVESLVVKNSEYTWNIESPILLQAGERQWAGYPSLQAAPRADGDAGVFLPGDYFVECVDAMGEKSSGTFSLAYNRSLLASTASGVQEFFPAARKRIAVYSAANELLYYDFQKDEWRGLDGVFRNVKNSAFLRETLSSGSVVCFLPRIYKDGENPNGLE